jgi:hypothetical protein
MLLVFRLDFDSEPNAYSGVVPGDARADVCWGKPQLLSEPALILKYYLILDSVDLLRISFRTITDILF